MLSNRSLGTTTILGGKIPRISRHVRRHAISVRDGNGAGPRGKLWLATSIYILSKQTNLSAFWHLGYTVNPDLTKYKATGNRKHVLACYNYNLTDRQLIEVAGWERGREGGSAADLVLPRAFRTKIKTRQHNLQNQKQSMKELCDEWEVLLRNGMMYYFHPNSYSYILRWPSFA